MPRGGARPGAGRPKDTKEYQTLIKEQAILKLREMTLAAIVPIAEKLIEKAKTGDVPAIKELLDRALGKPVQGVEMSGPNGKDLFEPSQRVKELAEQLDSIFKNGLHKGRAGTGR